MGIPRLSQDVAPYTENAIFGKRQASTSDIEITKLVIDGPSLVYHVYNAILRGQNTSSGSNLASLPSYSHINACLEQFLQDLSDTGTEIQSIIFDGALPLSKRPTRQDRLEKTRSSLDSYRKLWTYGGAKDPSSRANSQVAAKNRQVNNLREVLWNTSAAVPVRQQLLPPPPFMVASVIESLQQSKWSSATHIVPGEADAYCAYQAVATCSAVLSNDSDLLLYKSGPNGTVIMLRTIELVDSAFKCQCLRPSRIAKQLGISSILHFGFYRSIDSSVTTSVIAQRTREQSLAEDDPAWLNFQSEYQPIQPITSNLDLNRSSTTRTELDPRTAELVHSLNTNETLQVYLSTVLEDPTRDSAWSYGTDVRCLAYSILLYQYNQKHAAKQYSHVTEHARKGPRIAEIQLQLFPRGTLLERIHALVDTLQYHLATNTKSKNESNKSNGTQGSTTHTHTHTDRSSLASTVLHYHLIATDQVLTQYISRSKSYQPALSHILPSRDLSTPIISTTPSWDDIHFLATIQCTLYSLRMLNQIVAHVRLDTQTPQHDHDHDVHTALQTLSTHLASMPPIADLFPDTRTLHTLFTSLPSGTLARHVRKLLDRVDPSAVPTTKPRRDEQKPEQTESVWQESGTQLKKKRRKNAGTSPVVATSVVQPQHARATNAFALLQEHDHEDEM